MPFSALYLPENRVITIDEGGLQPRARWKADEIRCHLPNCSLPMTIVTGSEIAHHFRHMGGSCGCDYLDKEQWEESPQHRLGKRLVAQRRIKELEDGGIHGCTAVFEHPFPRIKRVADVLVRWPAGWGEVHEVQVSAIRPEEVRARVDAYRSEGLDVWWWFCEDRGHDNREAREMALGLGGHVATYSFEASWRPF